MGACVVFPLRYGALLCAAVVPPQGACEVDRMRLLKGYIAQSVWGAVVGVLLVIVALDFIAGLVDELSDLILESRNGSNIKLSDIATVEVRRNDRQNIAVQNGNPAFSMRIDRANGANVLETLNRVKKEVELINSTSKN